MNISKLPKQMSPFMGTIMILAWTLIIGPLGGILIGATTYFMLVENIVAVGICAAVLLLPTVLTLIWGCSAWTEAILNKVSDRTVVPNAKRRMILPS
jgi:hypothetical protein